MREHDDAGGRIRVEAKPVKDEIPAPVHEEKKTAPSEDDLQYLQPNARWTGLPNPMRLRAVTLFLTTIVLLITLWVIVQILIAYQAMGSWPLIFQVVFMGFVVAIIVLIGIQGISLFRSFTKLREPKTWLMRDLQAFDHIATECESAKNFLLGHLKTFPLEDVAHQRFLLQMGAQEAQIQELITQRRNLIEKEFGSSHEWLATYRKRFAEPCEAILRLRIKTMARRVAFSTMSCPIKTIDGLVILWASFEVCSDINRLYQFRLSKMSMAILLLRAFRNAFIATQIEDLADHTVEALRNEIQHSAHTLLGDIATKLSARFAEGVANGLLIHRLAKGLMKEMTVLRD